MARKALPKNGDGLIHSGTTGVRPADPKAQIPRYPARVRLGGSSWNFDGVNDRNLYPSPHNTQWSPGYVPRATRNAMMSHHKVYQGINNLKNAIIGDGARWVPAVNPYGPDKSYFEEALKYAQFLEFCSRQMRGSNWGTMRQMLDCITEGNKVAPISVREQQFGQYKNNWVLDTLHVWPEGTYWFFEDEYGNVAEIRLPGQTTEKNAYPIEKFFHLAWRPIDGNPYGTSVCSPVYDPFYKDIQTDFEEWSYMATFGRPSVIIFAAPPPESETEKAEPLFTRDGKAIMEIDPETGQEVERLGYQTEQNAILFQDFQAGSIWSMEHGSLVEVVEARAGGADLYRNIRDQNARNIMGAIYGTHQVTEAERNVSTGNQEVGEGVAGLNVTEGKVMLEQAEENQWAKILLELNFGPGALDLLPMRDYGSGQNGRMPKILNSVLGFATNGAMDKGQYWDFCASNSLPLPYPDAPPLVVRVALTGGADKSNADKTGDTKTDTTGSSNA